jgi:hypothetical protein
MNTIKLSTQSVANSDVTHEVTLLSRSEKTAVIIDEFGKTKRCKIYTSSITGKDYIMPYGTFLTAPSFDL